MIITGSSGFIGSFLKKEFPDAIGLDVKDGQNILTCDLPEADTVIHLAAQSKVIPSMNDPIHDATVNILGTIRLAKHYQNSKLIFASSGGCIQDNIESPYGLSKYCAEEYIKLLHRDYVILRLPNVYGHRDSQSVVDNFIYGDVRIFGDGSATRDYVHISDIIKAFKQAITWPTGTYHLGSGIYHSVLELAEATGKPIEYLPPRKGELQHTPTQNNTDWEPIINVIEYIKSHV
jgi:UDP-glucose 4-epimerase